MQHRPVLVSEPLRRSRTVWLCFWAAFGILAGWLAWAAVMVNIDFDDGYATIANSQHFLGISSGLFWERGPGMAWLLLPAEWLAHALALHPLDVHLHHATMALLIGFYLVATWWILQREFGARVPTLLAFLAALLTPVFFSYAPFISPDIFPGVLVLLLLRLASDLIDQGGRRRWWLLVAIGALLALIKQVYALVWCAVLLSQLIVALALPRAERAGAHRAAALASAALASGAITFLVYSVLLTDSFPDSSFWERPFKVPEIVGQMYEIDGGAAVVFYPWIYLRNLSAYGIMALLALPAGLLLSWRHGSAFQRSAVVSLVFLLACMQLISFKEVRYLALLAPLLAVVIVPAFVIVWEQRPRARWLVLALVLLDVARNLPEAARLRDPFYRDAMTGFLAELPSAKDLGSRLFVDRPLSFIAPDRTAFYADRYHRITHLGPQLRVLYGFSPEQWRQLGNAGELDQTQLRAGDYLLMSTNVAVRSKPFLPGNLESIHSSPIQGLLIAETIELRREGNWYVVAGAASGVPRMLLRAPGTQQSPAVGYRFEVARVASLSGYDAPPEQLSVLGLRFLHLCQKDQCQAFALR